MSIYAIIDASGLIVNRVVVDDITTWESPDGFAAVAETAAPMLIGGTYINGVYTAPPAPPAPPPLPQTVLSQDLMAQFTAADATAIQAAISGNVQFWLLWQALTTQKDPMLVTNQRFLDGWHALVQVLGQSRMDAIASALGVTVG